MNLNPFDDSYVAMNSKLLSACRERDQQIKAMDRFRRFDPDYLLSTRQVEKELEDRYTRTRQVTSKLGAAVEISEAEASASLTPAYRFSDEPVQIKAELEKRTFNREKLDGSCDEVYSTLCATREHRAKLEQELKRLLSFDELQAQAIICALDQEISQLEPEVEKVARNKQRIDELIGEHLAALNAARDQIGSLNRFISEANDLQQQLASAQNSYERKRVHEQCESRFKTGYPLEIVKECRWRLTKVTRDVEKLEQRIHSIIKRALMNVEHVVFDGNNFCYEHKRFIGLTALFAVVKAIGQKHAVTVVFDSSIRCHLKKSNGEIRSLFPKGVHVNVVPTRTKADETMLRIAKDAGYYVLSNNHFTDFPDMPAVHDNRILRHQIINGRMMIFDLDVDIALG